MNRQRPNHLKLAAELERSAADSRTRPCHKAKLLAAAEREREADRRREEEVARTRRYRYNPWY